MLFTHKWQSQLEIRFLCGIQVKNYVHRGPQGEVVVSAWVNLEAGL